MAVAALKGSKIVLMNFDANGSFQGATIPTEFQSRYGRLRTAQMGPDGCLYVLTSNGGNQDMVLRAGQSIKWIGRERFTLSVGNARATHLRLNGRDLIIPQPTQSVLRQYTISREMLP